MTSLDLGVATMRTIRNALERIAEAWRWYDAIPAVRRIHATLAQIPEGWRRMSRWLNSVMPKGLYARALLIIIAPMVILQSVVAFVFMERHWNLVTRHLSAAVVADLDRAAWVVSSVATKERKRHAAPPFITSKLQQTARYPVKKTMMLAQQLYEGIELPGLGTEGPVGLILRRLDS